MCSIVATYHVQSIVVCILCVVQDKTHPALHTAYKPLETGHVMLPQYCTVDNDVFIQNVSTTVTLSRLQYELPNDGHSPKYVGAF